MGALAGCGWRVGWVGLISGARENRGPEAHLGRLEQRTKRSHEPDSSDQSHASVRGWSSLATHLQRAFILHRSLPSRLEKGGPSLSPPSIKAPTTTERWRGPCIELQL